MDLSASHPSVNPKKRSRAKKTTPTDSDPEVMNDDEQESPTKKSKTESSSKKAKKASPLGPIPTAFDKAGPADKLLLHMKDSENKPWAEIGKALEDITGAALKLNTIQVRYARMKANLVVFETTDEHILLRLKKEIEDRFEAEKWQKIADGIAATSGNRYPSSAVQKKFKELNNRVNGNGLAEGMEE